VFNPNGNTVLAAGGVGGRRLLQDSSAALASAPAAAAGCLTVSQIIQKSANLTVLRSLLPLLPAELRSYLNRAAGSQFTLFAPSDAAFRSAANQVPDFAVVLDPQFLLGAARSASKLDARALSSLFAYHLIPGVAATAAQLQDGQALPTALKGKSLRVSTASGVQIQAVGSAAAVTQPDIQACRGVVHIIDEVLLPISLQGVMGTSEGMAPAMAPQGAAYAQQQQAGGA